MFGESCVRAENHKIQGKVSARKPNRFSITQKVARPPWRRALRCALSVTGTGTVLRAKGYYEFTITLAKSGLSTKNISSTT